MDFLFTLCAALGTGIGIGAIASATGRVPGPGALSGWLAIGLGLLAGAGAAALDGGPLIAGALGGLLGATLAVAVLGGFVLAAARRAEGAAGLAIWIVPAALVIAAVSYFLPPVALVFVIALIWLGLSRRRRAPRKYKGLRSLT